MDCSSSCSSEKERSLSPGSGGRCLPGLPDFLDSKLCPNSLKASNQFLSGIFIELLPGECNFDIVKER